MKQGVPLACTPILAAVTATAGGVVITGDMDGRLILLDAIWPLDPAISQVSAYKLP